MGAACSFGGRATKVTVESAMPSYCKAEPKVDDTVLSLVHRTWHLVVDEMGEADQEMRAMQLASSGVVTFYDAFYQHLFETEPTVQPLFRNSLKSQGRALVKMINAAVTLLGKGDSESLTTALKDLAARHVAYGVHPFHYAPVGLCILHAFKTTIAEEEWTAEAQDAWIHVYSLICQVMVPVAVDGWWTNAKVEAGQLSGDSGDHSRFAPRRSTAKSETTITEAAAAVAEDNEVTAEPESGAAASSGSMA